MILFIKMILERKSVHSPWHVLGFRGRKKGSSRRQRPGIKNKQFRRVDESRSPPQQVDLNVTSCQIAIEPNVLNLSWFLIIFLSVWYGGGNYFNITFISLECQRGLHRISKTNTVHLSPLHKTWIPALSIFGNVKREIGRRKLSPEWNSEVPKTPCGNALGLWARNDAEENDGVGGQSSYFDLKRIPLSPPPLPAFHLGSLKVRFWRVNFLFWIQKKIAKEIFKKKIHVN